MIPLIQSDQVRHISYDQVVKSRLAIAFEAECRRIDIVHQPDLQGRISELKETRVDAKGSPLDPTFDRHHLIGKQSRRQFHIAAFTRQVEDAVEGCRLPGSWKLGRD